MMRLFYKDKSVDLAKEGERPFRRKHLNDEVCCFKGHRKPFGDIGGDSDLAAGPMVGTHPHLNLHGGSDICTAHFR